MREVDAAVAVGFAMAVTYPRAGNIGGGGFMLIHLAKNNKQVAIDYRETAPAATTRRPAKSTAARTPATAVNNAARSMLDLGQRPGGVAELREVLRRNARAVEHVPGNG